MPIKRMRIFAGPNGSGKTTIINDLKNQVNFGVYINADDIEQVLNKNGSINFNDFQLVLSTESIQSFFKESTLSPIKHNNIKYWENFVIDNNKLVINSDLKIDSYLAADLSELIRENLLKSNHSFTYETVMSHHNKINFLKRAKAQGYRIYLYYIATEDPEININRVNVRVAQHKHYVAPETVKNRYYKSLENLKQAVKETNRAYIFDNSGKMSVLVAEITDGIDVNVIDPDNSPNWFVKYLVE